MLYKALNYKHRSVIGLRLTALSEELFKELTHVVLNVSTTENGCMVLCE